MCSDFQRVKIKKNPDKVVRIMVDTREYLPAGTKIKLDTGNVYEITGAPVGCGGGSILYPVQRLVFYDGSAQPDGFFYVLKECYPVSGTYSFVRNENGEIVPENRNDDSEYYLSRAKKLLLKEERLSRAVYQTASRMVPTRESASRVVLEIPGKTATVVSNTVTVMESLSEKGRSITTWIKENRRFAPFETFRIIQQLLFALKEVHHAGYLHLDIQDGNVFLKGTLEQKDELVTLIDFGSAKPMVDGKTAPIQDKVIFTTPGFAAPEIMLHNDGTLQLGAETDIYSVGCLALYLLTGSKPETRMLLENRTGIFLKPNQLRRIQCPRHLVDRMQQILAIALDRRPRKRYHSVDEMLRDVTDFVEALQPYRTDLSAVKYDAFICYKHGPIDSEVAVTLQRELENYRAPKGISQNKKPFKRVFVDEGELSSCADFGQQIREALQNSGWLIVVCSEDTPNSPWVQLEIDTFLETHSRSRVLCVMTGGDEKVSFPPQLKGNQNDAGEVLAADARGSDIWEVKKKLRKDALLKIAAPMLGTTFDSLKQRHKLYRMQKIAAVTAGILTVTAGFAAYAVNRAHVISEQAVRIEQEYENALINESLLLAEQAQKRLDDNDPLGAMELALKALPSEEQDRPVLTEAEYVLGKAIGIYTTPDSVQNTVTPVGIFDSAYEDFFLSLDGKHLIACDAVGRGIQIIDTATMSEVQHIKHLNFYPIELSSEYLLGENRMIIPVPNLWEQEKVCCMDYLTGNTLWEVPAEDLIGTTVMQDKSKVIVMTGKQYYGDIFSEESAPEDRQELTFSIYSSDSGELLQQFAITLDGAYYINAELVISPDGKKLAFFADTSEIIQPLCALYLVDMETEECTQFIDGMKSIESIRFDGDNLAVIRSLGITMVGKEAYQTKITAEPISWMLEFYDLNNNTMRWCVEHQCYDAFGSDGITTSASVQYTSQGENKTGILYIFSNQCILVNEETGEIIRRYNMSSSVLDITCTTNGFYAVNTDGSYYSVNYDNDAIRKLDFFGGRITALDKDETAYYVQDCILFGTDYHIRKYAFEKHDDAYVPLYSTDDNWEVYHHITIDSGYRFVLIQDNKVRFVDAAKAEEKTFDIPLEYEFSKFDILGTSADCNRMYWEKDENEDEHAWIKHRQYYCLDMTTGQITTLCQPEKPTENMTVGDAAFDGENLFFIAHEYRDDIITVWSWNLEKNKLEELYRSTVNGGLGSIVNSSLFLNEDATGLWFATQEREYDYKPFVEPKSVKSQAQLVYLDLATDRTTKILLDLPPDSSTYLNAGSSLYCWDDSASTAAVVFDDIIYVMDKGGSLKLKSEVTDISQIWFAPDNSTLFILSKDCVLRRYTIQDGTLIGSINLQDYSDNFRSVSYDFCCEYIDNNIMVLFNSSEGLLLDTAENSFKVKAVIDFGFTYDKQNDRFIAVTDGLFPEKTAIGYFPRYSVDDLIRKANEILS